MAINLIELLGRADKPSSGEHSAQPPEGLSPEGRSLGSGERGDESPGPHAALTTPVASGSPLDQIAVDQLTAAIVDALHTCYDPEIPVDIYELGLIYEIQVEPTGQVHVNMTLTSPMCPVAGSLPGEVEAKIKSVDGVVSAKVDVVWDPSWTPQRMSEAAKLQLNMGD